MGDTSITLSLMACCANKVRSEDFSCSISDMLDCEVVITASAQ